MKVTPEMIDAGMKTAWDLFCEDLDEEVVMGVYLAMANARWKHVQELDEVEGPYDSEMVSRWFTDYDSLGGL